MNETLRKIQELCESRNCDLVIRHYGFREICIMGVNDNDDEVFNVTVWYPPNEKRRLYIEVNSQKEQWKGGSFTKEEILLLLSIDDFNDYELGIKQQFKEEKQDE